MSQPGWPEVAASLPDDATGAPPGTLGEAARANLVVALDEREPVSFVCRSLGSSPPARLQWAWAWPRVPTSDAPDEEYGEREYFRHGEQNVKILSKYFNETGSESLLQLERGLDARYHGARVSCLATNELFSPLHRDRSLTASANLVIKCEYSAPNQVSTCSNKHTHTHTHTHTHVDSAPGPGEPKSSPSTALV